MEPEDGDATGDKVAAGGGEGALASPASVPCSICLEAVRDGGERSTARLLCGHQFHLDCIGSAFNAKGMMQCPNCRKIEKGDWLYANGCLLRDASVDDWTYDDSLYDINFSELSYGLHWCPFTRVARVPSSSEEGESPAMSYHGLDGHRAVFSVHPAAMAHSCPYLAYLQPLQPSSSSGSHMSAESLIDDPAFLHDFGSHHVPMSVRSSHPFPAIHIHYHRREANLPPYFYLNSHNSGVEQASVPSAARTSRNDLEGLPRPGAFVHPFVFRHGLFSRASTSADSVAPPFIGGSHSQAHVQDPHGSYQQHGGAGMSTPTVSGMRGSSGMRSLVSRAPAISDHSALYFFPSASSTGQSLASRIPPPSESSAMWFFPAASSSVQSPPDAEMSGASRFYAWERDQLTPFPLMPVERASSWWDPLQPPHRPSGNGSNQTGSWLQHGPERSSSSQGLADGFSHPPSHPPQMYPFI